MASQNRDIYFLEQALNLAEQSDIHTSPNPNVGAVIVKDGIITGQGTTMPPGQHHAEVVAIKSCNDTAGSTIYVTLEPCCTTGRTPPCTTAIINAGIKRAVFCIKDPNPKVSGKSIQILRDAGIDVTWGLLDERAKRINDAFFVNQLEKRTFVFMKTASTLDGKIATHTGYSKWITGEKSRYYVHRLRNRADGILVGINTVLRDDPMLNTRLEIDKVHHPARIVLDSRLRIPIDSKIIKSAENQKTIIVYNENKLENQDRKAILRAKGCELWDIDTHSSTGLKTLLKRCYDCGIYNLMIEGGQRIITSFIKANLIDKMYSFVAPIFIGNTGKSLFGELNVDTIQNCYKLKNIKTKSFDDDILVEGYLKCLPD